MIIEDVIEKDEAAEKFEKREWIIADKTHYGKVINWDKKEKHYLKACDENKEILGILNLEIHLGVAEVNDVLVSHDHQSRGIGRKLMQEAEKIAKSAGAHKMFVCTGEKWDARKLYDSLGYEVTGGQKDHHLHHDYVEYSKTLK